MNKLFSYPWSPLKCSSTYSSRIKKPLVINIHARSHTYIDMHVYMGTKLNRGLSFTSSAEWHLKFISELRKKSQISRFNVSKADWIYSRCWIYIFLNGIFQLSRFNYESNLQKLGLINFVLFALIRKLFYRFHKYSWLLIWMKCSNIFIAQFILTKQRILLWNIYIFWRNFWFVLAKLLLIHLSKMIYRNFGMENCKLFMKTSIFSLMIVELFTTRLQFFMNNYKI